VFAGGGVGTPADARAGAVVHSKVCAFTQFREVLAIAGFRSFEAPIPLRAANQQPACGVAFANSDPATGYHRGAMISEQSIFLVGPMGAGKSAVGKRLARRLQREFRDADAEIEARTGVDISFIFEKEGEEGFRRREGRAIDELTALPAIVLATGGGAVMDEGNRRLLAARGLVVYLHASVAEQLQRTRHSRHRPLLDTPDPEARLRSLMAVREPLYREVADLVIDTDGRKVGAVAEEIRRRLDGMAAP
jgi:shikimate kinase